MKAVGITFVLAAALLVAPMQATAEGAPIDRAAAMSAPVEDLVRAALAAAATRYVEVERPTHMRGPDAPLWGLRFATAARSAGYPGLCEATAISISLREDDPSPIDQALFYKVVGDLKPLPDMWNDAYGAELSRKCAGTGRVIPTESTDFGQTTFFRVGGDESQVWQAARALEVAIEQVRSGGRVTCAPPTAHGESIDLPADDPEAVEDRENRQGCKYPAQTVGNLSLARLSHIDVFPCREVAESYCVSAAFLRYAYDNRQALWSMTLKYDLAEVGGNRDVRNVTNVVLSPSYAVYD